MKFTAKLISWIKWFEKSHGFRPCTLKIGRDEFTRLAAEVETYSGKFAGADSVFPLAVQIDYEGMPIRMKGLSI